MCELKKKQGHDPQPAFYWMWRLEQALGDCHFGKAKQALKQLHRRGFIVHVKGLQELIDSEAARMAWLQTGGGI